jgi:hypothetical protein
VCRGHSGLQQVRRPGQREQREFGPALERALRVQVCWKMRLWPWAMVLLAGTNTRVSGTHPRNHAHNEALLLDVVGLDGLVVLENLAWSGVSLCCGGLQGRQWRAYQSR